MMALTAMITTAEANPVVVVEIQSHLSLWSKALLDAHGE
jgi:hypothetical protein